MSHLSDERAAIAGAAVRSRSLPGRHDRDLLEIDMRRCETSKLIASATPSGAMLR
jgi:hypothetical protein